MTRAELIQYITDNVYPNGRNEVTAPMVRDSLLEVVAFLGDAATYNIGMVASGNQGLVTGGNVRTAIDLSLAAYYTSQQTDQKIAQAIANIGLGQAAYKNIGQVAENNTDLVTGGQVYTAINTALTSAIKFQGISDTPLVDGSTTNPIQIDGQSYTAKKGDMVVYGGNEFLWVGNKWQQMGDESSYALKTITITGTGYLTGGGDLTQNRTLDISTTAKGYIDHGETAYNYFSNGVLDSSHLPNMYIGTTSVQFSAQAQNMTGIFSIKATSVSESLFEWDSTNNAWHFHGNVYADGWLSGGGISSGSGGGGGIDPLAMWQILTNNPSLSSYDNYTKISADHISFPVTSVVGLTGGITAQQIATALQLGTFAYKNSLLISDIPDLSGTYLPLSGGSVRQLAIVQDPPRIEYWADSSTYIGAIGFINNIPQVYYAGDWHEIWNDYNFTPANYLPLSAGSGKALTGDLYLGTYSIRGVGDVYTAASQADIYFHINTDSRSWWVGVGASSGDDNFVIFDATASAHRLKIDTIGQATFASSSGVPVIVNSTSGTSAAIAYQSSGTAKAETGWTSSWGTYIYDYTSGKHLGIATTGLLTYNGPAYIDDTSLVPFNVNTSAVETRLRLSNGGTFKADFMWNATANVVIESASGNYVNIDNSGVFKYNNTYTFYHSGNSNILTVPWTCSSLQLNAFASNETGIYFRSGFDTASTKYNCSILSYDHNGGGSTPDGITIAGYDGVSICTGSNTRNEVARFTQNGNLSIGYAGEVSTKLYVAGVAYATTGIYTDGYLSGGGLSTTSDEREKKNWRKVNIGLKDILNAPAGAFDWINKPGSGAGTTAQYWEKFVPELVGEIEDVKNLQYGPLAYLCVHALAEHETEQDREIRKLRKRVAELEKKLNIS